MSYSPSDQPLLKLDQFQVKKIDFEVEKLLDKTITKELNFNLGYRPLHHSEEKSRFAIEFEIKLKNEEENLKLNLVAIGHFLTKNVTIDEDFLNSDFVKLNAPAIVFPYVRSFITTVVVNSGLNPVILPTFNFNKLKEKEKPETPSTTN